MPAGLDSASPIKSIHCVEVELCPDSSRVKLNYQIVLPTSNNEEREDMSISVTLPESISREIRRKQEEISATNVDVSYVQVLCTVLGATLNRALTVLVTVTEATVNGSVPTQSLAHRISETGLDCIAKQVESIEDTMETLGETAQQLLERLNKESHE